MVMEVVDEDMDMACTDHPFKNQTPGGICAFCLQDKLGKLVSSSFQTSIFPATSSSSHSPTKLDAKPSFLAKKEVSTSLSNASNNNANNVTNIVFQRSRSTAVARPKGFWSFLSLNKVRSFPTSGTSFRQGSIREDVTSFSGEDERKVSRSRSVGCGSRSFSGDFFDRLSTGFGDCTLRRVESTREGKNKNTPVSGHVAGGDRVKCGGIFGGFSSSVSASSSSSASNWSNVSMARGTGHGRSRSWGWALASPMRAFSKPKRDNKRKNGNGTTPNLNAIPSILSVGG